MKTPKKQKEPLSQEKEANPHQVMQDVKGKEGPENGKVNLKNLEKDQEHEKYQEQEQEQEQEPEKEKENEQGKEEARKEKDQDEQKHENKENPDIKEEKHDEEKEAPIEGNQDDPFHLYSKAKGLLSRSAPLSKVQGREEEKEGILKFLRKCVEERKGGSLYISGAPGSGKSALIDEIFREFPFPKVFSSSSVLLSTTLLSPSGTNKPKPKPKHTHTNMESENEVAFWS